MIQGESDRAVPMDQTTLFAKEMEKAGSTVTVRIVAGNGHMINFFVHAEIYPFLDHALKETK